MYKVQIYNQHPSFSSIFILFLKIKMGGRIGVRILLSYLNFSVDVKMGKFFRCLFKSTGQYQCIINCFNIRAERFRFCTDQLKFWVNLLDADTNFRHLKKVKMRDLGDMCYALQVPVWYSRFSRDFFTSSAFCRLMRNCLNCVFFSFNGVYKYLGKYNLSSIFFFLIVQ